MCYLVLDFAFSSTYTNLMSARTQTCTNTLYILHFTTDTTATTSSSAVGGVGGYGQGAGQGLGQSSLQNRGGRDRAHLGAGAGGGYEDSLGALSSQVQVRYWCIYDYIHV